MNVDGITTVEWAFSYRLVHSHYSALEEENSQELQAPGLSVLSGRRDKDWLSRLALGEGLYSNW